MAEGAGGEKTETATSKRRKDSREKGQVLKSNDVAVAVSLLAMFSILMITGPAMANTCAQYITSMLGGIAMPPGGILTHENATSVISVAVMKYLQAIAPVLVAVVLIGVITNVMQFGFLLSSKAMAPKFSKLNPIEGMKRLFSSRSLIELVKSICKISLVVIIFWMDYSKLYGMFASMATVSLGVAAEQTFSTLFSIAYKICFALLVFSAFDYGYQYWRYEKDLKMSKYEVKMEYKQQEGDPQIKGKIKQKQREMAQMRMMQSVPSADVVITNPTHFAVALKYDVDGDDEAPMVIAKGQDLIALKIREKAKEAGVEIVEDKPLARALYSYCEIGMQIPVELYGAVADVLAYVYKIKNKQRGQR